jgi:hypothetical protein
MTTAKPALPQPVGMYDHPDRAYVWTETEVRWIAARDAQWKAVVETTAAEAQIRIERAVAQVRLKRAAQAPAAPPPPESPWVDFYGQPIRHGDRLTHPSGQEFVAVRLEGYPEPSGAWRAVYDNASVSRLCLQIGDKGRAVLVSPPVQTQVQPAPVGFLFKQWGEWGPDWEGAETCSSCGRTKFDAINSYGECGHFGIDGWDAAPKPLDRLRRVGKRAAGRLLDGVTHDGFPREAP